MTLAELDAHVRAYFSRVTGLAEPARYTHRSAELVTAGPRHGFPWATHPGIYAFGAPDSVVYIGRAAKDSLRARLWDQVRDRPGAWNEIVTRPDTQVVLYAFASEDWFWVASLELYLLQQTRPQYNRRRC